MDRSPKVGDIIIATRPIGDKLASRPAIVVQVWGNNAPWPVNAVCFRDGMNDGPQHANCIEWLTSIPKGEGANTWHWPEGSTNA